MKYTYNNGPCNKDCPKRDYPTCMMGTCPERNEWLAFRAEIKRKRKAAHIPLAFDAEGYNRYKDKERKAPKKGHYLRSVK